MSGGGENGGYVLENARSALNLFLQKNRQPTDIKVDSTGAAHCQTFTARLKVYVPRFRRTLHATETASNKKNAQNKCALNMVVQLYKCGAIPSAEVGLSSVR